MEIRGKLSFLSLKHIFVYIVFLLGGNYPKSNFLFFRQSAKSLPGDAESSFVSRQNSDGKTALDLSLQRRHRRISWTLIQSGGARQQMVRASVKSSTSSSRGDKISSSSLLQSVPEFDNGNNFLHIYARNNYAMQVRVCSLSIAHRFSSKLLRREFHYCIINVNYSSWSEGGFF